MRWLTVHDVHHVAGWFLISTKCKWVFFHLDCFGFYDDFLSFVTIIKIKVERITGLLLLAIPEVEWVVIDLCFLVKLCSQVVVCFDEVVIVLLRWSGVEERFRLRVLVEAVITLLSSRFLLTPGILRHLIEGGRVTMCSPDVLFPLSDSIPAIILVEVILVSVIPGPDVRPSSRGSKVVIILRTSTTTIRFVVRSRLLSKGTAHLGRAVHVRERHSIYSQLVLVTVHGYIETVLANTEGILEWYSESGVKALTIVSQIWSSHP